MTHICTLARPRLYHIIPSFLILGLCPRSKTCQNCRLSAYFDLLLFPCFALKVYIFCLGWNCDRAIKYVLVFVSPATSEIPQDMFLASSSRSIVTFGLGSHGKNRIIHQRQRSPAPRYKNTMDLHQRAFPPAT